MTNKKVLYYPGAGWDNEFINKFPNINLFILVDTLPNKKHYIEGQAGFVIQKIFLNHLTTLYGIPIEKLTNLNIYHFRNKLIYYYYYNTNCDSMNIPENVTDILISGMWPNWYKNYNKKFFSKYNIYNSCSTPRLYNCTIKICTCKGKCDFKKIR